MSKFPIVQCLLIASLAFGLAGCDEEEEKTEDEKTDTVNLSTDKAIKTIKLDNDFEQYDVKMTSDDGNYTFEDNIRNIEVGGEGNQLTIKDDTSIEELVINGTNTTFTFHTSIAFNTVRVTGNNNQIIVESDKTITIKNLSVSGTNNFVDITSFETCSKLGDTNRVTTTESQSPCGE